MKIKRDVANLETGLLEKSTKPRLSAAKKDEVMSHLSQLRALFGSIGPVETVEIVFTDEKKQEVLTIY